jgi:hypothetical protein
MKETIALADADETAQRLAAIRAACNDECPCGCDRSNCSLPRTQLRWLIAEHDRLTAQVAALTQQLDETRRPT